MSETTSRGDFNSPCPAGDCDRTIPCRPPAPECPHPWHAANLAGAQPTATAREAAIRALLVSIETHNATPVTPENLRYAATHAALCRSWIFDVLTGLADRIEASS